MITTVEQQFLKPGRYRVGGKLVEYTASDLAGYAVGTNKALAAGVPVPLLVKHAPNGADDELYEQFSTDGAKATDCAGWLKQIKVNTDGSLSHVLDVTSADAAKGIADKSIKFTSPELRKNYVDGKGRAFGPVIRHVALTPTPRNPEQGEFVQVDALAVQFSLDDFEGPVQMGEEDFESEPPESKSEGTADNPDIPKTGGSKQKSQAIAACLSQLGAELPSDIDFSGLSDEACAALLASLKTLAKAKAEADMAKEKESAKPDDDVQEATGMQFSEDEIATMTPAERKILKMLQAEQARNAKLGERIEQFSEDRATTRREQSVAELRRKLKGLPPALRAKLEAKLDSVQFSESGEAAALTLSEAVEFFREGVPSHLQFDEGDATEATAGEFTTGDPANGDIEAARALNDEIDKELGYKPKKTVPA